MSATRCSTCGRFHGPTWEYPIVACATMGEREARTVATERRQSWPDYSTRSAKRTVRAFGQSALVHVVVTRREVPCTRSPRPDRTYYLTDKGRALCGEHLGSSARYTGLDISGQPILALRPEDVRESIRDGWHPCCEDCGRKASLLVA